MPINSDLLVRALTTRIEVLEEGLDVARDDSNGMNSEWLKLIQYLCPNDRPHGDFRLAEDVIEELKRRGINAGQLEAE